MQHTSCEIKPNLENTEQMYLQHMRDQIKIWGVPAGLNTTTVEYKDDLILQTVEMKGNN